MGLPIRTSHDEVARLFRIDRLEFRVLCAAMLLAWLVASTVSAQTPDTDPVSAYLTMVGEARRAALRAAYQLILSSDPGAVGPRVLVPNLPPTAGTPLASDAATRARLERARIAEVEGRLADARREYTDALAGITAGRHLLHIGIGRLAQVEGDLDAAIEAFGQAVRLSPNDPFVHREAAAAYAAAGREDDAFAELVAALLLAPGDAEAFAAIGQLFLDGGRAADAIPAFRKALTLRPARYQTHYALAVALSRVGQSDDANREFERFERLSRDAIANRRRDVVGQP